MVEFADRRPHVVVIGGQEGTRTDDVNGRGREGWKLVIGGGVITARVRCIQESERSKMLGVNDEVEVIVLPGRVINLSDVDKIFGEGFSRSLVIDADTRLAMVRFAGPGEADGHGNVANNWRTTFYRPVIGPP